MNDSWSYLVSKLVVTRMMQDFATETDGDGSNGHRRCQSWNQL